ncbi:MAG: ATP-binding protein [Saprospiraceae bacterium]
MTDEYLRLAYHGLRAKDPQDAAHKSINTVQIAIGISIDLDPNLPKIEVVPQEIGRIMLNLINIVFQAVDEKSKMERIDFKPQVTVSKKSVADYIEICVSDNGSGIPNSIKDKIFQPFLYD